MNCGWCEPQTERERAGGRRGYSEALPGHDAAAVVPPPRLRELAACVHREVSRHCPSGPSGLGLGNRLVSGIDASPLGGAEDKRRKVDSRAQVAARPSARVAPATRRTFGTSVSLSGSQDINSGETSGIFQFDLDRELSSVAVKPYRPPLILIETLQTAPFDRVLQHVELVSVSKKRAKEFF